MILIRRRRKVFGGIILLAIIVIVSVIGLRAYTLIHAAGRIYSSAEVPKRPVAIIFGALVYPSGRPSHMLADRVTMGAELYHTGKVATLLMTGDNSRADYNEPEAMRQLALNLGVPDEAIVLDYAGFRTYDSCYRARDIFLVKSAILITQEFHLPRAILTCDGLGLDVIGVSADEQRPQGYKLSSMVFSQVRELPATTLAALDLVRGRKPTYLGDPIPIAQE